MCNLPTLMGLTVLLKRRPASELGFFLFKKVQLHDLPTLGA